jgi:Fe-S cluster assembly protein SufD
MTTPKDLKAFQSLQTNGWPDSIQKLRRRSFEAFQSSQFPSTHEEDWRFTNVAPFLKTPFEDLTKITGTETRSKAARGFTGIDPDTDQIVFIDGKFSKELSSVSTEILIGSLHSSFQSIPPEWEDHLGKIVPFDKNAFVAWNTAFFKDAALVRVPDGFIARKPVRISFVTTGVPDAVSFPRVLILLGKESQLSVLESFTTLNGNRYFTNAVTEIFLDQGAILQHVKVQQDSVLSLHIASSHVIQKRDSSYTSLAMTLGSELSREHLRVTLDGIGGDCTLNGIYLIGENQHADHHTTIDHAKPHGTSRELYKGILNGKSRAVFNGKVIVRKDAQKTDAEQMNRNLLLSEASRINTTPQLEILADDVKCKHGATIGHLDEDELFYLRSRGISDQSARTMLMKAFLQEVTARLPEGRIQTMLDELVSSRLLQFTGVQA